MLETTIGVGCLVLAVIFYGVRRHCENNVYLKFKDQKVGE